MTTQFNRRALHRITVNGTELTYRESGDGPLVIAVHGALTDRRIWYPLEALLSAHFRFIAYSHRGFGLAADDAAESLCREDLISDLIALVESLDCGPAHLMTWSFGGEIATYAMLRRPDLFASAVQFEPSLGAVLPQIEGGTEAEAKFRSCFAPLKALIAAGRLEDAALRFIEIVTGTSLEGRVIEQGALAQIVRDNAHTLLPFLQLPPAPAVATSELAALEVPTLLIHGERSHDRYRLIARHLAENLGDAELFCMSGVGHDAPYRAAVRFAAAARGFFLPPGS